MNAKNSVILRLGEESSAMTTAGLHWIFERASECPITWSVHQSRSDEPVSASPRGVFCSFARFFATRRPICLTTFLPSNFRPILSMRTFRSLLFALVAASLALAPTAAFAKTKKAHHAKSIPASAHHRKAHSKSQSHGTKHASAASASSASLSLEPSTAPASSPATPGLRAAPTRPKSDNGFGLK